MTGKEHSESFLFYDNKNNEDRITHFLFRNVHCRIKTYQNYLYGRNIFYLPLRILPSLYITRKCRQYYYVSLWCTLYFSVKIKKHIELLTALKDKFESLSIISIDFEYAVVLAIKQVFNNAISVQLCFYYLNQSIWRKVQDLRLAVRYKQDKQFREAVKMIPALAFLPENIEKKGR